MIHICPRCGKAFSISPTLLDSLAAVICDCDPAEPLPSILAGAFGAALLAGELLLLLLFLPRERGTAILPWGSS